ncbi:MAG: DSD1 family PLP-dependent enzyme [Gammaproteobacteria bacterium]|jgi:3-hydroxy-D-aspartate aldolase|nr:DSD1 family PLP-dependent enzyme [Gammaproteobacteria bacterium]MBT5203620.1 DSD1 family PLP-dependent enzyme [Gammaproteobacteria bacterium]MBT5601880.1 DSD1 family PLP-dependent enzyme [Gammaproteobacteria bacterium]
MPVTLDDIFESQLQSRPVEAILLDTPVPLDKVPTPALLIDEAGFQRNLERMAHHVKTSGLSLRTHAKMHKSPVVARKQLAAGAVGICCAKVSEAEVMQLAGIKPILITSPVISPDSLRRVVKLANHNEELQMVIDCQQTADQLQEMLCENDLDLGILVDIDPGMGRTGIQAGRPAFDLVVHIVERCPNLKFLGLQMYAGNCMHISGHSERRKKYFKVMEKGSDTRDMIEASGIQVNKVSGGGTGTYDLERALGVITELQAGSFAFMDIEYRDIGGVDKPLFEDFEVALHLLVTAISQPQSTLITVDAGFKSIASDKMAPEFKDIEGLRYHWGGDEHGIVQLNNPSRQVALGDKLELLTPHCDPTVNLHDFYFVVRDGLVHELWPISTRGLSR